MTADHPTETVSYQIAHEMGYDEGYAAALAEARSVIDTIHKNAVEQTETFELNTIRAMDKTMTANRRRIKDLEARVSLLERVAEAAQGCAYPETALDLVDGHDDLREALAALEEADR